MKSRSVTLFYSPFLTIRLVGELFYLAQIVFMYMGWSRMVWLANQNRALERFLINVCNKKFQNVRCRTFRVWWSLQRFTIPITLDVSGDFSQTLSGENFEGIMWTLVSVRSISPRNMPAIRTLFPDSYGIFEKKANV